MSTSIGPDDPLGPQRRVDPDDVRYTEEVRAGDDVGLTEPVEGRVTRREVITPATSDPVTVRGTEALGRRTGPCWNRIVAGVVGAIYLAVGIAGFFLDRPDGQKFAGRNGTLLFDTLEVNNLHNVVHLAIGALLLLSALAGHSAARSANLLVALVYLVVGIGGIFARDTSVDVLALNPADHILHLGTALLLGLTALADRFDHDDVVTAGRARTV